MSRDRDWLLSELLDEIRGTQRASDSVDDLVCDLLGINRTDARCVDLLDQHGRMSAGDLAAASGLSSGAITAVVDRLERAGYAHRVADPTDRRRVLIELTPAALEASAELMAPLAEAGAPLLAQYDDDQLRLVLKFQRESRELQERHAEWLRERRAGRG